MHHCCKPARVLRGITDTRQRLPPPPPSLRQSLSGARVRLCVSTRRRGRRVPSPVKPGAAMRSRTVMFPYIFAVPGCCWHAHALTGVAVAHMGHTREHGKWRASATPRQGTKPGWHALTPGVRSHTRSRAWLRHTWGARQQSLHTKSSLAPAPAPFPACGRARALTGVAVAHLGEQERADASGTR